MREMLGSTLRGDIRVEMTFDPDLWPVEVDPGELELAVINVCVNARDAMPGGGTIRIAASNVRGRSDAPAECVELSVADTGSGIADDIIGRVFDPFFTTKDVARGRGWASRRSTASRSSRAGGCG